MTTAGGAPRAPFGETLEPGEGSVSESFEIQNLTRGLNEVLILGTLQAGPRHGYQIAIEIEERSNGYFALNHGTLYPILHQLEKEGLIVGEWDDGRSRRRKKEYVLTAAGRGYLAGRIGEWTLLHERLSAFLVASAAVHPGAAANQR
jgi:PadR family transcriptional regulator, regulatory protein PadR